MKKSDWEKYKAAERKQSERIMATYGVALGKVTPIRRTKPKHRITPGWGPAEHGGWPFVTCTCGWLATNKDIDLVEESAMGHLSKFFRGELK